MAYLQSISNEHIEEGLDRKNLTTLEKRFLRVNSARLERARSALTHRQQLFLDLLPLFLHTNHPMMPGYISHRTPSGVVNYHPSKHDLKVAANLVHSFRFNEVKARAQSISAIFMMGSVGTVAYSHRSDFDIWVCHGDKLADVDSSQLQAKCFKLSRFAHQWGLEVNFFVMSNSEFLAGKNQRMNSEASGNTQHYLLLDEFYRSSILLAGQFPLWWFVPAKCEHDYANYCNILLSRRYLNPKNVIDFGSVYKIPAGEFIGAGIWQLYKAIESPYKSVLKLLLLESYASEYPKVNVLSLLMKQLIYDDQTDIDELDPYVVGYRKIERYLLKRNEVKRLELARRCFYFKVNKRLTRGLTGNHKSWQRELLEKLVAEWGWSEQYLKILDNRQHWKAPQVMVERKALVNELNKTYRYLFDFVHELKAVLTISAQEITVLGRKLHACFEKRSGKIDWINPHIAPDLAEAHLCFVEQYDPELHHTYWLAYPQTIQNHHHERVPHLKRCRNFLELLLWCHCNEILVNSTRCDIKFTGNNKNGFAIEPLLNYLRQWLPMPKTNPSHEAFENPARASKLLLCINLNQEPYRQLRESGLHQLSEHDDILNYSTEQSNLILCMDIVSINTWNEVDVIHFGNNAVIQLLQYLFRLLTPACGQQLPQLDIYCNTPGYGTSIRTRMLKLLKEFSECFYSAQSRSASRYIFSMSGCYYCCQYVDNIPSIVELSSDEHLLQQLSLSQKYYSPIVVDSQTNAPRILKLIADNTHEPRIKVAYKDAGNRASVYVLDEKGSLYQTNVPFRDQHTLLRPLHRFIRAVLNRQEMLENINEFGIYPVDFYHLVDDELVQVHISTELSQLSFFNVQVVAHSIGNDQLGYNFYCNETEFSQEEFGEQLFDAVARNIVRNRRSRQQYPCYITDLDLTRCHELVSPSYQLQLSHYLSIKSQLEHQLNSAIQQ